MTQKSIRLRQARPRHATPGQTKLSQARPGPASQPASQPASVFLGPTFPVARGAFWLCDLGHMISPRKGTRDQLGPKRDLRQTWGAEFLRRLQDKCAPRKSLTFSMPISIFDLIVKHVPSAIMISTYLVSSWDPLPLRKMMHFGA